MAGAQQDPRLGGKVAGIIGGFGAIPSAADRQVLPTSRSHSVWPVRVATIGQMLTVNGKAYRYYRCRRIYPRVRMRRDKRGVVRGISLRSSFVIKAKRP